MTSPALDTSVATPRIVKAKVAQSLGAPIAFNLRDLQQACDEHFAGVQERSRRLIGETAAEAERIRKDAFEAGRRDGYRDGLKAAESEVADRVERLAAMRLSEQLETVLPSIRALGDSLRVEHDRCVARWEREATRLAVAIAERLVRKAICLDPSVGDRMIGDALRLVVGSPDITVRLSPPDHERLGGSIEAITEAVGRLGDVKIVSDPSVEQGGCVVESRSGQIDSRLETVFERIACELTGEVD